MRLLQIWDLEFREFFGDQVPPYCILSHRWIDGEEPSFKEFRKRENQSSSGYQKIIRFCVFLRERWDPDTYDVKWAWIDTVCIDKRSSAELSEAINSMFAWYERAHECIAYLSDVPHHVDDGTDNTSLMQSFQQSSWFTRGWTLQELIAPEMVVFCDQQWTVFGHKCSTTPVPPFQPCGSWRIPAAYGPCLAETISSFTSIELDYLAGGRDRPDHRVCIAQKLSWASKRTTTREEDQTYCLLGLCGVNMPLLYGEGSRAFLRLLEEIIRTTTDQSIFAARESYMTSILAPSVQSFSGCGHIVRRQSSAHRPRRVRLTSEGVEMDAVLRVASDSEVYRGPCPELRSLRSRLQGPIYFLKLGCEWRCPYTKEFTEMEIVLVKSMELSRGLAQSFVRAKLERPCDEFSRGITTQQLERRPILVVGLNQSWEDWSFWNLPAK